MAGAPFCFNASSTSPIAWAVTTNRRLPLSVPVMVTASSTQSYWATADAAVDAHLKQAIPMRPPLSVYEPMHHLTFAAPRTAAPALCMAACELVGGHPDQAIAAASAIHLMHAASYTHEHLPLTDRPNPQTAVIRHKYGPNMELLISDGIVPFAMEVLAQSEDPTRNTSERILRVIIEITRAFGSEGVVGGRYYELQQMGLNDSESSEIERIERVVEKKEGTLHACGAACGAIMGGGSELQVEKLRRYGFYVGKIQKILSAREKEKEKEKDKLVDEMRNLGINELRDFEEEKIEAICSFVKP